MECCVKCSLVLNNDKISCSGFCCGTFHYSCADVDRVAYKQCLINSNIFWFCNDCRDLLINPVFKMKIFPSVMCSYNMMQQPTFDKLQDEIACNRKLIEDILGRISVSSSSLADVVITTPVVSAISSLPLASGSSVLSYADAVISSPSVEGLCNDLSKKQFASNTAGIAVQVPSSGVVATALSSNDGLPDVSVNFEVTKHLPHSQSKSICGTNRLSPNFGIQTVAPKFWLHLSRFNTETQEDDILSMAKACLDTDAIKVGKLVPKNCNLTDLDYVCFKLGIDEKLRDKALNADTWPTGVYIRPFNFSNFRTTGPPRAKYRSSPLLGNTTTI